MTQTLLVITDHRTHTSSNSLYKLCLSMAADTRCRKVYVCSKGYPGNESFFEGIHEAPIWAVEVDASFGFDPTGRQFSERIVSVQPDTIDAILLRLPPPVDAAFLYSLTAIVPHHRIINRPDGLLETASKAFLMQVSYLCPEPFICHTLEDGMEMARQREIVLKPYYSFGGRGLIRLSADEGWIENERLSMQALIPRLQQVSFPMLGMTFLKNVILGDKRTIVAHGKVMGSAVRYPAPGGWMCNVAQGGRAELAIADEEERIIENTLTPLLHRKGIILYGFDTLVNDEGRRVLSEINTVSTGGLVPLEALSGKPVLRNIAERLWDYLEGNPY